MRNYSGWPFSNVVIFSSYVSELAADRLQCILIFMMLHLLIYFIAALISGIGRGQIRAFISALR